MSKKGDIYCEKKKFLFSFLIINTLQQPYRGANSAAVKETYRLVRRFGPSGKLTSSTNTNGKDRICAVLTPAASPSCHLPGMRMMLGLAIG